MDYLHPRRNMAGSHPQWRLSSGCSDHQRAWCGIFRLSRAAQGVISLANSLHGTNGHKWHSFWCTVCYRMTQWKMSWNSSQTAAPSCFEKCCSSCRMGTQQSQPLQRSANNCPGYPARHPQAPHQRGGLDSHGEPWRAATASDPTFRSLGSGVDGP